MKSKSSLLLAAVCLSAFAFATMPAHAEPVATPVGFDPVAWQFEQSLPMPDKLPLTSEGDLKNYLLRNVRVGTLSFGGAIVFLDGLDNEGQPPFRNNFVQVEGDSPERIVNALSAKVFNIATAKSDEEIYVSVSLSDQAEGGHIYAMGNTSIKLPAHGNAAPLNVLEHIDIEILDSPFMDLPGSDQIVAANISARDEWGNVYNSMDLYPWESGFHLPLEFLGQEGNLLIVRREPVVGGGYRNVSYNYSTKTGKLLPDNLVRLQARGAIVNYDELDMRGLPLAANGVPVIPSLNLRVEQYIAAQGGGIKYQSQPTGRIESDTTRLVLVSTGFYEIVSGAGYVSREKAKTVKLVNTSVPGSAPIVVDVSNAPNGQAYISVGPGSWDVSSPIELIKRPLGWNGRG